MTTQQEDSRQRLQSLKHYLHQHSAPAAEALIERRGNGDIQCFACGHRCLIKPGRDGVCRVRFNDAASGQLLVPFGYVAGIACDPIEKKPFFHFLPASNAVTFGMLGCDLHCGYCQNWVTSQMLRDADAATPPKLTRPQEVVELALSHRSPIVVSSYNEPLITSEWAMAIFLEARAAGLRCGYVSNGNATPQVLDYLRPVVEAYKVDLKTFDDRHYRQLGCPLENVTAGIRMLKERGFWVEIVTLIVPGFSDDGDDLKRMAGFLAEVDPLMPWHVTAFHPDYRMNEYRRTEADDLLRAVQIGRDAGLKYIYTGNLPGRVGELENTHCHNCGRTLIRRHGFMVQDNLISPAGRCPACQTAIPGIWGPSSGYNDGHVRPLL